MMKTMGVVLWLGAVLVSGAYAEEAVVSPEEYDVYSAVLRDAAGTDGAVVNTMTTKTSELFNSPALDSVESKSGENLGQVLKERYIALNKTPVPLENKFAADLKIAMITDEEMNTIFKGGEGWNIFREKYGRVCTVNLSRVAFNDAGDVALVYVGIQCDWLAGHGDHVLLKKKDGVWSIVSRAMDWIS